MNQRTPPQYVHTAAELRNVDMLCLDLIILFAVCNVAENILKIHFSFAFPTNSLRGT